MPSLAEEYIAAVKANDHNKMDKLFNELDRARKTVSKKKVMAAYKEVNGNKDFLRRRLVSPASHHTILGKSGGKTRRGRGTRRTRRA